MAFYPDELSPIDRVSVGGNSKDLIDINTLKNRRQWKSFVLGKKDMGLNSFATIAEEKEDEISNDGIPEVLPQNKPGDEFFNPKSEILLNKKITFAKPRKYISSRVPDRKRYADLKESENENLFPFKADYFLEHLTSVSGLKKASGTDVSTDFAGPNLSGAIDFDSQPFINKNLNNSAAVKKECSENRGINDDPLDSPSAIPATSSSGRQRRRPERGEIEDFVYQDKTKMKSPRNVKPGNSAINPVKRKEKFRSCSKKNKKSQSTNKAFLNSFQAAEEFHKSDSSKKAKKKSDKRKCLNMREVVNVYKNLAYGSEREIKSFVEKLSFVEDEPTSERNRNLLSVLNLKALESKIKNFAKTNGKFSRENEKNSKSQEGKHVEKKNGFKIKSNKKTDSERWARQKVVKVPTEPFKSKFQSQSDGKKSAKSENVRRSKSPEREEKAPWKYVGMQSILDKMYFVYPAYPPPTNRRKSNFVEGVKVGSSRVAGQNADAKSRDPKRENDEDAVEKASKSDKRGQNIKRSEAPARNVISSHAKGTEGKKFFAKDGRVGNAALKSSLKGTAKRFSATTVCTVEFSPTAGRGVPGGASAASVDSASRGCEAEIADPSLLVYLHGTKALNVKSPYSDRQFSRVKFFQKDGRGMPLIKGLVQKVVSRNSRKVSVKNVSLPEKPSSHRSLNFLNFGENTQMIQNDFLHSQNNRLQQLQQQRQQHQNQRCRKIGQTAMEEDRQLQKQFDPNCDWQNQRLQHQQQQQQQRQLFHSQHCYDFHSFASSFSSPSPSPSPRPNLDRDPDPEPDPDPDPDPDPSFFPIPFHQQHRRRDISNRTLSSSSPESFVNEIFENIKHLQCLPDTKKNRKLISKFFDYLDEKIENSKGKDFGFENLASFGDASRSIPILGC